MPSNIPHFYCLRNSNIQANIWRVVCVGSVGVHGDNISWPVVQSTGTKVFVYYINRLPQSMRLFTPETHSKQRLSNAYDKRKKNRRQRWPNFCMKGTRLGDRLMNVLCIICAWMLQSCRRKTHQNRIRKLTSGHRRHSVQKLQTG